MSDSSSAFFALKPEERSIEENWNMFKTSLAAGMCQFIPQKSSRPKFKLPWIDTNLKREMRKKEGSFAQKGYSLQKQPTLESV